MTGYIKIYRSFGSFVNIVIDQILAKSAKIEYRIVDMIAAVMNSPLFRGE